MLLYFYCPIKKINFPYRPYEEDRLQVIYNRACIDRIEIEYDNKEDAVALVERIKAHCVKFKHEEYMATTTVFQRACTKLEHLLKNKQFDGSKYKSHRIAVGTLITEHAEDPERAEQLLEAVKKYNDEKRSQEDAE